MYGDKRPLMRKVFIGEYTLSTHIVSGSDDRTVRIWRLTGEFVQLEHVLAEHIRGGWVNVNLYFKFGSC
jgi:WD40 repeat protein